MNTITLLGKIKDDLRTMERIYRISSYILPLLYILYLSLAIAFNPHNWLWYANIVLLVLTVASYIYDVIVKDSMSMLGGKNNKEFRANQKSNRKIFRRIVKYVKRTVKIFTLGSSIALILTNSSDIPTMSVFITSLLLVVFVIEVLYDILISMVSKQYRILKETISNDLHAPINKVKDIYRKVTEKNKTDASGQPISTVDKIVNVAGAVGGFISKFRKKGRDDVIEIPMDEVIITDDKEFEEV